MSITRLPRELGIVLRCDGTDTTKCEAKLMTGNILAKVNRKSAMGGGWGRGLRKGRRGRDYCPEHMELERELFAKQQADWKAEIARRAELRKAKASAAPLPKKPRKKKAASESASPTASPSADSAPAPATP